MMTGVDATQSTMSSSSSPIRTPIDVEKDRFPFCIVWTPIPVLTWILPFVGHMGMADSEGIIYDFAGPYFVNSNDFAFGKPCRYLQLNPVGHDGTTAWNNAVARANGIYEKKLHNLCFQNCHSHVATHLDTVRYMGFSHWNMIILAFWMFFAGKFVSPSRAAWAIMPSLILWGVILLIVWAGRQ